jgi:predicted secreted protein
MTWPLALAIFYTMWWVVLFAVLPFGVRSQAEAGVERPAGTDAGAPVDPRIGVKLLATTVVSAVLFAAVYAFVAYEG